MGKNAEMTEFDYWLMGCKKTNLPIIPVEVPKLKRYGTGVWETHSPENHNNPYAHPVYHVYANGEHIVSTQCFNSALNAYRNAIKRGEQHGSD